MLTVQEQEFLEWKQNNVTVLFFASLKNAREMWKEGLIKDNYDNEDFVKGKAQAFQDAIEMTYQEMMETINAKH